ncbi:hypothetical protein TTRE_0000113401 [Trichuris trichiura]|uniref:Nascent polypeptide-associated complex subunit alpha-like UBA domain-containing protein n=2 Tax=Trichuris TaxID=36086 RepID=A0A085LUI8_9BILA|nr:hypothetical protein M513_10489 [Trichuris suis]KFD62254.1 hypothetical protein M514_10489 [Trichuris suis]KHJ40634.1 hypothetical protein D918_09318 [Trichuris suis]CDW52872.1 hypothetical protein TTRE_0000113401 [Trichuris trichiura]
MENNSNEEAEIQAEDRKPLTHKHDSGAADLQKVTDYQEEKELPSQITQSAMSNILDTQNTKRQATSTAKVVIKKADIEFIMNEMEVTRHIAEKALNQNHGNVKEALKSLLAF